jgi:hypothetical protein
MCELPPPWKCASFAERPMTAMLLTSRSGSTPSFLSSTMPAAATRRASA